MTAPDGCLAAAVGVRHKASFCCSQRTEEAGSGLDLFLLLERDGGHLSRSRSQSQEKAATGGGSGSGLVTLTL